MKKTNSSKAGEDTADELRPEYRFDYQKAKPNRFADQPHDSGVVVRLDPDVSAVFMTPDSVNEILRALIKAMPTRVPKSEPKPRL